MLFKASLLFLTLCVCLGAFGQKTDIDSLQSLVKSVPADTTKVWLLNRLVDALKDKDNNQALVYATQAKNLAEVLSYKKGMADALQSMGWILFRKGDFAKSLDVSTQALRFSEQLQDHHAIARCFINIAAINVIQKHFDAGIANLKKSCKVSTMIKDNRILLRGLNNLASTYLDINQVDSAHVTIQRAISVANILQDPYMTGFVKLTTGDIYLAMGQYEKIFPLYRDAYEISDKLDKAFLKVLSLYRLAKLSRINKEYDHAIRYLNENIRIAESSGYHDELEHSYKLISEVYYQKENVDQAYDYQSKYIVLHDSLHNQRSSEQMLLAQSNFDSQIKEAQIELLTKDAKLREEVIKSQSAWNYIYIGCVLLLIALAFILFYYNHQNSKAKFQLQEKNVAIQRQAHELRALINSKDKLFSIISHDLRSPVASLRALMEMLEKAGLTQEEFIEVTQKLKRNLDSVHGDLDNLLLWAQTQLKGLQANPEVVALRSIVEEKINLFDDAASMKEISFYNEIGEDVYVYADPNHIQLVFRNLIANAIKFNAIGGTITIAATEADGKYEISVSDSGVGIDMEDMNKLFNPETHFTRPGTNKEKGAGIGLLLTKEFVEVNNGTIWLNSQLGQGAAFTFTLQAKKIKELV